MLLENIQAIALRCVYQDFKSERSELLKRNDMSTIKNMNLRILAIEVFKSLNDLNPSYMKELLATKPRHYEFRDPLILKQPVVKTSTYGLRSFSYYGAKIWNLLPNKVKSTTSLTEFKSSIQSWDGPSCQCTVCASLK